MFLPSALALECSGVLDMDPTTEEETLFPRPDFANPSVNQDEYFSVWSTMKFK